jgi:hypothetical protein
LLGDDSAEPCMYYKPMRRIILRRKLSKSKGSSEFLATILSAGSREVCAGQTLLVP